MVAIKETMEMKDFRATTKADLYLEKLLFYSELIVSKGTWLNTLLLSAGTQDFRSPEPDKPVETLSLSPLLIVSRYSTVVVLVVVVVLEVVSASSQQRPVRQSSCGCSIFLTVRLTKWLTRCLTVPL